MTFFSVTDRKPRPEAREEVWCIKCKGQGHNKDHYQVFTKYWAGEGSMPLRLEAQTGPSAAPTLWCVIYQIRGKHTTDNCHLLQKYTQTSQQLFCNFCRSVGHDERTCRSYELMMDRTLAYSVKTKKQALNPNAGMACAGFHGRGRGHGGMGLGRGRRQLICYNCGGPRHYARDCMNPM